MAEIEAFNYAVKNGNPDPTKWPQLTSSTNNQLDLEGSLKLQPGVAVTQFSNDVALAGNSALTVPTEQAVKTYVDTQVGRVNTALNTALATKALLAGAANQDFTTKNLMVQGNGAVAGSLTMQQAVAGSLTVQQDVKVVGNLDVTGTTIFRNIEQHQGDLQLGDADDDEVRIHGKLLSTHSSGALQVSSPMQVTGTIVANRFVGDGSGLTGLVGTTQWTSGAAGQLSYSGGNVGINTATPTRAKLEVAGTVGSTVGLFGADAQGIALVANWAAIGINAYYNNGWKSIAPGWTANIHVNQDAGGITFQIGQQRSTTANAAIALANHFHVGADGAVSIPGRLNFGAQVRQMINLWNAEYGIGVQAATTYFRTGANFCWFRGGAHSDVRDNPGGGTRLMALNEAGDLILSARTNPTGNPAGSMCRAMVDAGNILVLNWDNDYPNGVNITNGRFVSSRDLKQNIADLSTDEAMQALQDLSPVKFSYKTDDQQHRHVGFIAEEVPDLLAAHDRRSIGALDIVAVLTKVVQEQQATITTLVDRINTLELNQSPSQSA
jgi:Chaperone of endosialidase